MPNNGGMDVGLDRQIDIPLEDLYRQGIESMGQGQQVSIPEHLAALGNIAGGAIAGRGGIGKLPTGWRATTGPIPTAARGTAEHQGYAVQHPNTKEVMRFGADAWEQAMSMAQSLGTKVYQLYSMGGK